MKKLLFVLALFLSLPVHAALLGGAQDELLAPDKAFALTTRVIDGNTLEARWKIAKDYYLYRNKFQFEAVKGDATVLAPQLPKGKKKNDPLFGEVETYVKSFVVRLPLKRSSNNASTLSLRITSQGCNDPIGVCYPPIIKTIEFALPAVTVAAVSTSTNSLSALKQLIQPGLGQQFLHPDKAFGVELSKISDRKLRIHFRITDGYYLYRNKINFTLRATDGSKLNAVKLGKVKLPRGKKKKDPTFGSVQVYTQSFDIGLPVMINSGKSIAAILEVGYQGCADKGICYPPATKIVNLAIADGGVTVGTMVGTGDDAGQLASSSVKNDPAGSSVTVREYWLAILGAFGVGLLLTFTPCVLPMIPILSSIIVGQGGEQVSKTRGGSLAAIYVLGTIVTYAIAGAFAGGTGEQLQAYFQNVWAIGIFATVLVLLALSMFGFYELQMPSFIQSRLQTHSQKLKGGSIVGVFLMGTISALIVGACVSPLLISVLAVAIKIGDPMLGALIMSSMAMGMGVVLIGIGMGAGFLTPKAGVWMDRVKYFFGVMLLGVAVYLLGVLPQVPVMFLWAALFIVTSIYLGAIEPLPEGAGGWRHFFKGLGMLLLVWGIFALIGAFSGNRDILRPVSMSAIVSSQPGTASSTRTAETAHIFQRIGSLAELDAKLAQAKAEGKGVVLDYFATWCTDCVRMEKTTFVDPDVVRLLRKSFIALQVDVTDPNDADSKAVKKRYSVFGPPAMLFFDANGRERKDLNFYGYKSPADFLKVLNAI